MFDGHKTILNQNVLENVLTASQFDANGTNIQNVYACVGIKFSFNVISHISLTYARSVMMFSSSPLSAYILSSASFCCGLEHY